ncbi:MAG: hypothetical protein HY928_06400 [Elusimicrobia bacterium]|nr:hypothetical protein [Elusimicrobiota bacterium]
MLSDTEKRELLEMADSAELRSDFRELSRAAAAAGAALGVDDLLAFLSFHAGYCPAQPARRPPSEGWMLL